MLRRTASRSVLALGLLVTLAAACDKSGKGSAAPGGGDGAAQGSGVVLRYKATNLRQKSTLGSKFSGGGQYGEVTAVIQAALKIEPDAGGKLKVSWKIDQVDDVQLKGVMAPKEGATASDPKKTLLERGFGIYLSDARGETDSEASQALPENKKKRDEMEAKRKARQDAEAKAKAEGKPAPAPEDDGTGLVMSISSLFQLPSLPQAGLELGKPVKVEEQKEETIQGAVKLPLEIETTYTLVKVDQSSGKRIAEVKQETEASGATEMGGGMLVFDQTVNATLLFNLDDGIPVSLSYTSTQSFSVGEQGGENTNTLETTFAPG